MRPYTSTVPARARTARRWCAPRPASRPPDSIQAATALLRRATGFLCNEAAFRRVQDLEILVLDDLLARKA